MEARLLDSIPDTQLALGGLGRTHIYELVKSGDLKMVKIGRRSFVTRSSISAYVDRISTEAGDVA